MFLMSKQRVALPQIWYNRMRFTLLLGYESLRLGSCLSANRNLEIESLHPLDSARCRSQGQSGLYVSNLKRFKHVCLCSNRFEEFLDEAILTIGSPNLRFLSGK